MDYDLDAYLGIPRVHINIHIPLWAGAPVWGCRGIVCCLLAVHPRISQLIHAMTASTYADVANRFRFAFAYIIDSSNLQVPNFIAPCLNP